MKNKANTYEQTQINIDKNNRVANGINMIKSLSLRLSGKVMPFTEVRYYV